MGTERIDAKSDDRRAHEATGQLLRWLILALRPPTKDTISQLLSVDPLVVMGEAGVEWVSPHGLPSVPLLHSAPDPDRLVEMVLDELETEYVRLFVNHPSGRVAHPEALAWLAQDGPDAQSEYSLRLGRVLDDQGLTRSSRAQEPVDHLTVLLELLYSVDHGEAGTLPAHPIVRGLLAGWLPRFLSRLDELAPPPIYRTAGTILALLFVPETTRKRSAKESDPLES